MASLNRATLVGNLGKDPEVRQTQAGKTIVTLSLATAESWKDKNTGERQERTEWHRVVIFSEPLAKIAEQYLRKGAQVMVEGAIKTRKWNKDGVDHYTTEIVLQGYDARIVMLGGKREREDNAPAARPATGGGSLAEDLDDDIPFSCECR